MEPINITAQQFLNFVSSCEVEYESDERTSMGYLKDDQGNIIGSIDYRSGSEDLDKNIYISDDEYFNPDHHQRCALLTKIDEETKNDRSDRESWLKEPYQDEYDVNGVKRSYFF